MLASYYNTKTNGFKEPGGSLPSKHKPASDPYIEQHLSSLQHHNPISSTAVEHGR